MNEKKLVVFDLDGTLNKTELYSVPAYKKALAEINIFDKTDEFIISHFGARCEDIIHLLTNSTDPDFNYKFIRRVGVLESEFINEYCGEFEGTTKMLEDLVADGYQTAVCSNASERYIKMVLNALKLTDKIKFIQPLLPDHTKDDTLKILLNTVKPSKALMVGDRIYDKNAAYANNIPFIGCMYGFNKDEVKDADIAVTKASEIYDAVKKLIG